MSDLAYAPSFIALNKSRTVMKTVGPAGTFADYVCTGTNDHTTINTAITAVNAAGGGEVRIRAGTYSISGVIVPMDKVHVSGEGPGSTILAGQAGLSGGIFNLTTRTSVTPLTDFTLSDLKLDGTNMPSSLSTSLKGINVLYCLRFTTRNVVCYNTPATGFGQDFMVDSTFTDCIADTCGRMAGDPGYNGFGQGTGGYVNESVQYVNCLAISCGNNGFLIEQQFGGGFINMPRDYQYTNCYAISCKRGFRNSSSAGAIYTNCVAANSTSEGWYFATLAAASPPIDVIIIGCQSYGNGAGGINFLDDSRVANAMIIGSRSFNNGNFGIRCGGDKVEIVDNICYGNVNDGILVHPTSTLAIEAVKVTGNTAFNNTGNGITVNGGTENIGSAIIALNHTFDNQGTPTQVVGISVLGIVNNFKINGNTSYGNKNNGILVDNDAAVDGPTLSAILSSNTVFNNGRNAVAPNNVGILVWAPNVAGPLSDVLIYGNHAYDNQGTQTQTYGLQIKDYVTSARVFGNDFSGNLTGPIQNTPISDATIIYENNLGVADVATKSANYTLTSLDKIILTDTSGGNKTMTLPTAVNRSGRRFTIKKTSASNTLTVATTSSQTIDGSTTIAVSVGNESHDFLSDGSNWQVI